MVARSSDCGLLIWTIYKKKKPAAQPRFSPVPGPVWVRVVVRVRLGLGLGLGVR